MNAASDKAMNAPHNEAIIIIIIICIQHQIYTVGKRSCQRCPSKKLDMQELIMGLRPRGSVSQLQCL